MNAITHRRNIRERTHVVAVGSIESDPAIFTRGCKCDIYNRKRISVSFYYAMIGEEEL